MDDFSCSYLILILRKEKKPLCLTPINVVVVCVYQPLVYCEDHKPATLRFTPYFEYWLAPQKHISPVLNGLQKKPKHTFHLKK